MSEKSLTFIFGALAAITGGVACELTKYFFECRRAKRKLERNSNQPLKGFGPVFFLLTFLLFILIPLQLKSSLNDKFGTLSELGISDWLDFWGSYLGSAFTVIITLFVFILTYRLNLAQNTNIQNQNELIRDQNQIIRDQNAASKKSAEEQMRLQDLPFINLYEVDIKSAETKDLYALSFDLSGNFTDQLPAVDSLKKYFIGLSLRFQNIGVGPVISFKISSKDLGHLSVGEYRLCCFFFPANTNGDGDPIPLTLTFHDRQNRNYKQEIKLSKRKGTYRVDEIMPPELI